MEIIDAHCHIVPNKIAELATINTQKFYDIPHSAFICKASGLLEQCKESGVNRCVVSVVATNAHQPKKLNEFLSSQVNLYPDKFLGMGSLYPESETIEEDFYHLKELGLLGVKLHPDIQGCKADSAGYKQIYSLCSKEEFPILMHTGDKRYDNSNPERIEKILKEFPNLKIIGAHLGGWSLWNEAADRLYKYDNFYVDTCSSFYMLSYTDAKKIINKYGTHKVIFGTDYPIWKQEDEIKHINALGFNETELENIFAKNILRVLKTR